MSIVHQRYRPRTRFDDVANFLLQFLNQTNLEHSRNIDVYVPNARFAYCLLNVLYCKLRCEFLVTQLNRRECIRFSDGREDFCISVFPRTNTRRPVLRPGLETAVFVGSTLNAEDVPRVINEFLGNVHAKLGVLLEIDQSPPEFLSDLIAEMEVESVAGILQGVLPAR